MTVDDLLVLVRPRVVAAVAVVALAVAVVVAVSNSPGSSSALLPTDVEQSLVLRDTAPGAVVHFGFTDFLVAEEAPPVRVTDVDLLGKPPGLEVVEVFSLRTGEGHSDRFVGTRGRLGIKERDVGDLSDMVLQPGDTPLEISDRIIVVGVRAHDRATHTTEGLRVHYTSGGESGWQDYDYKIGVEIVPAGEHCDDTGYCGRQD